MIELRNNKVGIIRERIIWFADEPYDVSGATSVIFRQCKNKLDVPGFEHTEFTTLVINLTSDLDSIWSRLSAKRCRYPINRALRENISIPPSDDLKGFRKMHVRFAKQKGFGSGNFDVNKIRPHSKLFLAVHDNEVLSGHLYLVDENKMRLLFAASNRFQRPKAMEKLIGYASRLLIWEAIKWGKNNSLREFDFGGYYVGSKPDRALENINQFKKSFGGEITTHYNYFKEYPSLHTLIRSFRNAIRTKLGLGDD